MDLQDYNQKLKRILDKFEAYWEKRYTRDPNLFPIDLPVEKWDEQLLRWLKEWREKENGK